MQVSEILAEKCWKGYRKDGMKTMFGKRVPNCVKKEAIYDPELLFIEDLAPKGPEITIGAYTTTHFFMCGSAIETAEKHAKKPGMESLIRLQDMVYKLEKIVMDHKSNEEAKDLAYDLHDAVMDKAREIGIEKEVADYQESHLNSIVKGDPEPGFGRVDLEENLRKWFSRNKGTGWVDCKTGKPCGRSGKKKRRGYPACRPTKAQCKSKKAKKAIRKKTSRKRVNWKK